MQEMEEEGPCTSTNGAGDREQDIAQIFISTARVAFKGCVVGGSLYAGLGLLSAVSSKRIFTRPTATISNIVSLDLIRFSSFIGASSASYKLVTALLQKWQQHHNKSTRVWWIPVVGGLVAGIASSIDEPNRRRTILLYIIARAIGATVKILNRRGYIPTVPQATALLFSIVEGLIILCVTKTPYLLPSAYYKAILHWSVYYTDEKLDTYFRKASTTFLPCSHAMHPGSCHLMAANDFKNCFSLYSRIYLVLYSIPLLIFRLKEMRTRPRKAVKRYIMNVLNSSLFFAIDSTLVKYLLCLLRNFYKQPSPAPSCISFMAGFIGGLSVVIERPSRQLELLYYATAQLLYIAWKLLCIKKPLRLDEFPAGSIVLYCMSLMVVLYSYAHEREALSPLVVKALDFLLKQ